VTLKRDQTGAVDPDLLRRIGVTASALVTALGAACGAGAFGGPPVAEASGGALRPDATLLAPAGPAFAIWSLIYLGLLAYTVHQWLPGEAESSRHRRLGWLVAPAMLLTAFWIWAVQTGWLGFSMVIMAALVTVLAWTFRQLIAEPPASRLEAAMVDAPLGLYFGWIMVAAAANLAAGLTAAEADLFGWGAVIWSVMALAVLAVAAATVSMAERGRLSVAAGVIWGLVWIALQRILGGPPSEVVAAASGFAAFLVLVCALSRRQRVTHEERLAVRQEFLGYGSVPNGPADGGEPSAFR
jgi:hypothetical protein